MPQLLFTPGKDLISLIHEAGWVPGPVWTGSENLAPTGIRSPDRPAHSQSLYRLRYPAHILPIERMLSLRIKVFVRLMWSLVKTKLTHV
jgi:hypothetical protein